MVELFEQRILALSKAHRLLARDNWDAVSLREMIGQILRPFGGAAADGPFSIEGDDIPLQSKTALTLAMVFHELATNASRHGALSSSAAGGSPVDWRVERRATGDWLCLRWQESGGPPVSPPGRSGFGSRLIAGGLARDVDGEVRLVYELAGVVCEIALPIRPAEDIDDAA